MSLLRRVGLLVAGTLVSSLLVALPGGPAHADYDLTVTWPAATQINPNVTSYTITVSDSGPGNLYAKTTLGCGGNADRSLWRINSELQR